MNEDKFNAKYNPGKILRQARNFNSAEELGRLHVLMEKGVITMEEFQKSKSKLL